MKLVVTGLTLACLLTIAAPASAEWFADVFVGSSFTENSDVTVHGNQGLTLFRDVEFDRSLAYGGRFGRYFDAVPFLGVGVDFFHFSPRIGLQRARVDGCVPAGGCTGGQSGTGRIDISSSALSLDVLLRLPLLKSKTAPWGALQPYVSAGIPLFVTTVTPRTTSYLRNHDDDTDYSFGYKLAGGVAFQIVRNLMVFGEYRFTHVEVSVDELRSAITAPHHAGLKTDLDTHSALIGLSARW
jgi:opacity protein-like surface antigen